MVVTAEGAGLVGGRLRKRLALGDVGGVVPPSFEDLRRGANVIGEFIVGDGKGVSKVEELLEDGAAGAVDGRADLRRAPESSLGRPSVTGLEMRLVPSVESPLCEGLLERRLLETLRELRESRLTGVEGPARRLTHCTALASISKHLIPKSSTRDSFARCPDDARE